MKWKILILIGLSSPCFSESFKTLFNACTGCSDYYTRFSSTTLPSGSTIYIQNTSSPTITTQKFNVQQGKYSRSGFIMNDGSNRWGITISTSGALTTIPK